MKLLEIKKQFVKYDLALKLKNIGFNIYCIARIDNFDAVHIKGTKRQPSGAMCTIEIDVPLWQQVFDWFEEVHQLNGEIHKQPPFPNSFQYTYWYYCIIDNTSKDLNNSDDKFSEILEKSEQPVVGKYINEELFEKYIFEDEYGFHTKEKAMTHCIENMINIVNEKNSNINNNSN